MFFKRCIQVAGALVLTTGNAWCEPESDTAVTEKSADPSVLEWSFAQYQVEPSNIPKAAVFALLNRGWDVQNIEKDYVVGSLGAGSEKPRFGVEIRYNAFPKIEIRMTEGSVSKSNWLIYLKQDMLRSLFSCVK